jgi:transposase
MDNASWRKTTSPKWGRFEPLFLPPYSPDLNPIERLWLILKAHWFSGFYAKSLDELIERLTLTPTLSQGERVAGGRVRV